MTQVAEVGFLGCGQMARALAHGLVEAHLYEAPQIILSDVNPQALLAMKHEGFRVAEENEEVLRMSKIVINALKPQVCLEVLASKTQLSWMREEQVLVSIAAGVTLEALGGVVRPGARIIRVMPNICCLAGQSASTYALSPAAKEAGDGKIVSRLLSAVGRCWEIPEALMSTATAVVGSGPAFVFMMIDALADAGVRGGLPRDTAREMASQMVMGSALMALKDPTQHLGQLKDQVCSPAGSTIEGVTELERRGFRGLVIDAIHMTKVHVERLGTQ